MKLRWYFLLLVVVVLAVADERGLLAGFDSGNIGSVVVGSGCDVTYYDVNGFSSSFTQDSTPQCSSSLVSSCANIPKASCGSNFVFDEVSGKYVQCKWVLMGLSGFCKPEGSVCQYGYTPSNPDVCFINFKSKQENVRVVVNGRDVILGLKLGLGWIPEEDAYLLEGFQFYDDSSDSVDLVLEKPIYQGSGSVDCSTLDCHFYGSDGRVCEPVGNNLSESCELGCCKTCYTVAKTCTAVSWGGDCLTSGFKSDVDVDGWYGNMVVGSNIYSSGYMGSCMAGSGARYAFKFYDIRNSVYGVLTGVLPSSDEPYMVKDEAAVGGLNEWGGEVFFDLSKFSGSPTTTTVRTTTTFHTTTTSLCSGSSCGSNNSNLLWVVAAVSVLVVAGKFLKLF